MGVHVGASGIAVAHIQSQNRNSNLPELKACQFFPCSDPAQRRDALARAASLLKLHDLPVNYVLTQPHYSMLLVEQPLVPAEEMKQAVRWRIKDLVNFNVDTAAIDIVNLPEDTFRGRSKMIYVVAASRDSIDRVEQIISGTELRLQSIDVAELALCNLLQSQDTKSHGVAMMHLDRGQGVLNLIKDQTLYLTRNFKVDLSRSATRLADSSAFEHLLLETQRSLDYYESQLGQAPATELLLTPMAENSQELGEALNSNLGLNVRQISIDESIESAQVLAPELQQKCLLAIAAALRLEAE